MSIAVIAYLIAAGLFLANALGWRPAQSLPLGLFAFALGHILVGLPAFGLT